MGKKVSFRGLEAELNTELALRAFGTPERKLEECLPKEIIRGLNFPFLKEGQRVYPLNKDIPLKETQGKGKLSKTLALVRITHYTHELIDSKSYTLGSYSITRKPKK